MTRLPDNIRYIIVRDVMATIKRCLPEDRDHAIQEAITEWPWIKPILERYTWPRDAVWIGGRWRPVRNLAPRLATRRCPAQERPATPIPALEATP